MSKSVFWGGIMPGTSVRHARLDRASGHPGHLVPPGGAPGRKTGYKVIVSGSTTELPELVPAVQEWLEPLCPNTLEAVISLLDDIVIQ